jgi:hypothetical protein
MLAKDGPRLLVADMLGRECPTMTLSEKDLPLLDIEENSKLSVVGRKLPGKFDD